jgi:hypothetical protein
LCQPSTPPCSAAIRGCPRGGRKPESGVLAAIPGSSNYLTLHKELGVTGSIVSPSPKFLSPVPRNVTHLETVMADTVVPRYQGRSVSGFLDTEICRGSTPSCEMAWCLQTADTHLPVQVKPSLDYLKHNANARYAVCLRSQDKKQVCICSV